MGRRSVTSTKSGKFMNPTDQARKEARKKELKKNKKQRLLVRTAVLKNKDPGLIIKELDKLDEVEYNPLEPPQLAEKVLKDKRKKLKETLDRVMKLYQKENPSYWSELRRIESDYERRRFHRIQYFEAVKQAESVSNVEDIPLPDIPAPGGVADIPLPGGDPSGPSGLGGMGMMPPHLHLPPMGPMPEVPSILKKAPMIAIAPGTPTFQGRDPPGVPVGPAPDLSDMDEMSSDEEEEMDTTPALVDNKSKGVRFQDDQDNDKTLSEMDRFMKEVEEEFKSMAEEDLKPPGTEGDGTPTAAASGTGPEEGVVPPASSSGETTTEGGKESQPVPRFQPEEVVIRKPDTAAAAANAIAAATSSRPPPPNIPPPHGHPQYYPPAGMNMPGRMRFPPPMPPMMRPPGGGYGGPRPPAGPYLPGAPPPQGHGRYRPPRANVFSGAPQMLKSDSKIVSDSMIQAKPQIRSLSADVTRFIPTAVKTRKDDPEKPKKPEYQIGQSQQKFRDHHQPPRPPQQSKDDAYADFMKEMSGLM